jgi:hypothetical protein
MTALFLYAALIQEVIHHAALVLLSELWFIEILSAILVTVVANMLALK